MLVSQVCLRLVDYCHVTICIKTSCYLFTTNIDLRACRSDTYETMNIAKFARLSYQLSSKAPLQIGVRTLGHGLKMVEKQTKIQPPRELLTPLNVPFKYLFGPGPSNPSTRIYNACAMTLLGHFQADFHKIMDEVKAGLQYVFQTRNKYTLAITGAGHAAMEASIMNLVERGEPILVCVNGMWGLRAREIAERQGEVQNDRHVADFKTFEVIGGHALSESSKDI